MTLEELRAALEAAKAELRTIDETAGDSALTAEQQTRFEELITEKNGAETQIILIEARMAQRASLAASIPAAPVQVPVQRDGIRTEPGDGTRSAPNVIVRTDPFDVLEDRSLRGVALERALVDSNLRAMESVGIGDSEAEKEFEKILKRHSSDTRWAENILARQKPEYASAFAKVITDRAATLNEEERAALAIGTNTAGGYLLPTLLDPTLILTNSGSANDMRRMARKVTLTEGTTWRGVTTAGVTASWDAELTEVSDDSPAIASVNIPTGKGAAFVQSSIEAFEDIANLATDIRVLFADAKDRLEGAAFMTGSGASGIPTGLFTAINASSSLQVVSTTAATIGEVDIHALYKALPQRWRGRGSFVANPLYTLAIKRLGTAVSSTFSGDLTAPVTDRILGRPSIESDDAPSTQTTTALDQEIVYADLSQYIIVDRPGSGSVEFIPHLFNVANNLPDGRRGWYFYWRTGGGFPNVSAGRILVDKTSA